MRNRVLCVLEIFLNGLAKRAYRRKPEIITAKKDPVYDISLNRKRATPEFCFFENGCGTRNGEERKEGKLKKTVKRLHSRAWGGLQRNTVGKDIRTSDNVPGGRGGLGNFKLCKRNIGLQKKRCVDRMT